MFVHDPAVRFNLQPGTHVLVTPPPQAAASRPYACFARLQHLRGETATARVHR